MKKPKILAVLLAVMLLATVFAGCAQANDSNSASSANSTAAPVGSPDSLETITYAFATFTSVPAEITAVEDAINAITEEAIGVHVNLLILSPANYSQQIALMISSEQDLDMFHTLGDLNQYVAKKQIIPLDDLLGEYGQDILEIEPEFFMKAGEVNGETYGVPFYMGKALAETLIYRKDILDEVGISPDSIKSLEDMDAVYAAVKEKYPDMVPLAPLNQGDSSVMCDIDQIDLLSDPSTAPIAVLLGDDTTVLNIYETEEFRRVIDIARDWSLKGYIPSDAATTNNLAAQTMAAGTAFSAIGDYAGNEPYVQFAAPAGGELSSLRLGPAEIATGDVNTLSRVIPVTSKHSEAAMKFLNLCYTNADIAKLLTMGIEGRDHIVTDDGRLAYPEGENMMSVPYNAYLSAATSNQFLDGVLLEGSNAEDRELQKEENFSAWRSPAFGFTFDSSPVKTQYSAVNNVINQYLPGLRCGSLDPETEIPKFLEALAAAGIDDIIAEKQAQLDNWLAQQ